MIQTKSKTIASLKVEVTQFPARLGFRIQTKLLGMLGSGLGELIGSSSVKGLRSLADTDISPAMGTAIGKLIEKVAGELTDDFIDQLLSCTMIDGKEATRQDVFNETFAGKYDALYKVLFFVLEVNYGSFLSLVPVTGNTTGKSKVGIGD